MSHLPLLSTERLSKRFGGLVAVDHCDIEIAEGSITGLIGPNGAGKSTVFNLITGFLESDDGEIRFGNERIDRLSAHHIARRGLMRTFQVPRELKDLTVLENLLLVPDDQAGERLGTVFFRPRRIRIEEKANIERARSVIETVGLLEKATTKAGLLSGGQKKLLELARCLMGRPRLILLDEPTAGVNPTLIRHIMTAIRNLHGSGITLVIIEHNMNVVMKLCDRVIVLDHGRVLATGTPTEIQNDPVVLSAYLGGAEP